MTPENWKRLQKIFDECMELPVEERSAHVRRSTGDDVELRDAIMEMIDAAEVDDGTFVVPTKAIGDGMLTSDQGITRSCGNYLLERLIDQGATASVYSARSRRDGTAAAVKVFPSAIDLDARARMGLATECRIAQRLEHPGIVRIYEFDHESSHPYIAMELVEGGNLADYIESWKSEFSIRSPHRKRDAAAVSDRFVRVARLTAEIARALDHAHRQQVIHRDVKPRNILMTRSGSPKLADFGIAKDLREKSSSSSPAVGTPHYASPEIIGAVDAPIDHRADIYSLGVVLYELLLLDRPFNGRTADAVLRQISETIPRSLRRVDDRIPVDLETICERAMAYFPEDRYVDARAMADDLERFAAGRSIVSPRRGRFSTVRLYLRLHRRRWKWFIFVLVACALVALLTKFLSWRGELDRVEELIDDCNARKQSPDPERLWSVLSGADRLEASIFGLPRATADRVLEIRTRRDELIEDADRRVELILNGGFYGSVRTTFDTYLDPELPRFAEFADAVTRAAAFRGRISEQHADALDHFSRGVVEVRGDGWELPGATSLFATPRDPISGLYGKEIRLDPVGAVHPLTPGEYRFTIVLPDGNIREFARTVAADGGSEIIVVPKARRFDPSMFSRISAAAISLKFLVREAVTERYLPRPIRYDVAEFLIGKRPVTNGEYKEFVEETKRVSPLHWRDRGKTPEPADWADRPVTMVTLDDARAYAEWRGWRLPTRAEWELAVRGPKMRSLPWDETSLCRVEDFNLGAPTPAEDPELRGLGNETSWEWNVKYIRASRPLGSGKTTISDLIDPIGNIWEWVDQAPFEILDGRVVSESRSAFRLGLAATTSIERAKRLGLDDYTTAFASAPNRETGFRCAISVRR